MVTLFTDGVLALLCAAGLGFLLWWCFGLLLRPLPRQRAWVIISGRGEGEALEQSVRAFLWLRGLGLRHCPIVIADIDLTPRGRELALHLAARWDGVILWPVAQLHECVTQP